MRNLSKLAFQRVVMVSLAILLQIIVVLTGVFWLREYRWWINTFLSVLSWVAVLVIMTNRSNPSYKVAWIVLILAFPVAGLTIYLLFGGNKASSRENRKMERIESETRQQLHQDPAVFQALEQQQSFALNHARYLHTCAHYPIYDNSAAEYFPSGESCFERMCQELEKAEHYIFLEYFIVDNGHLWSTILGILKRKVQAGVDVRVIYDDFGCITRLPAGYAKKLRAFGIQAHAFSPYIPVITARLNNRDHRKLMIIDGRAAFTGGVNLADEYINIGSKLGHWKDEAILITGEAAWSMTVMFLSMWGYVDKAEDEINSYKPDYPPQLEQNQGYLQPFADSPLDYEDVGASIFQSLIQTARQTVWIMTPYLILDDKMTSALIVAGKTGVDVRIITPAIPDKWYVHAVTRANYEVLTAAGVRIFEYTPGFIHSKVCLADGCFGVVGTVNMDFRSLYLHFEDAVYLYDSPALASVKEDFEKTFPICREITYAQCQHVHLYQRLLRTLLRMLAPLM